MLCAWGGVGRGGVLADAYGYSVPAMAHDELFVLESIRVFASCTCTNNARTGAVIEMVVINVTQRH